MRRMPLGDILTGWSDGDEIGWDAEAERLWATEPEAMRALTDSVREVGVIEPILLGPDGRVWDGHHRVAAALAAGSRRHPRHLPGRGVRRGAVGEVRVSDETIVMGRVDQDGAAIWMWCDENGQIHTQRFSPEEQSREIGEMHPGFYRAGVNAVHHLSLGEL